VKKSSTDTCCLTLPLKLEKWQEDRLAKRFEIARQLYNTLVHAELKRLVQIKRTAEYRENERKIRALDWNDPGDQAKLKGLYKERRKSLKTAGFTDYSFTTDMGKYYKHFVITSARALPFTGSHRRSGRPLIRFCSKRAARRYITKDPVR